jgi:hypothetical protein
MMVLRSSCRSSTLDSVIAAANHDVDVTTNDVEIQTFRLMIDCRSEKMLTSPRQDQHLIDTDKLNSVNDL